MNDRDSHYGRQKKTKPLSFTMFVVALVILAGLLLLLNSSGEHVRYDEAYPNSASKLQFIARAFHDYASTFNGKLPPAVVADKAGRSLYSWRVCLLPFLDEINLFNQFHLDEPWDSPHNKKLLAETPRVYWAPGGKTVGNETGLTHYQVFVGPGTAFERAGMTLDNFHDSISNTLLVVEATDPVPWSKPVDLVYDPNGPLPKLGGIYTKPVFFWGKEIFRTPGFNACFVSGSWRFIRTPLDEALLRALITCNGNKKIDLTKLD